MLGWFDIEGIFRPENARSFELEKFGEFQLFSLNIRRDLDERFEEMMEINAHSLWILVLFIVSLLIHSIHDPILPTGGFFQDV